MMHKIPTWWKKIHFSTPLFYQLPHPLSLSASHPTQLHQSINSHMVQSPAMLYSYRLHPTLNICANLSTAAQYIHQPYCTLVIRAVRSTSSLIYHPLHRRIISRAAPSSSEPQPHYLVQSNNYHTVQSLAIQLQVIDPRYQHIPIQDHEFLLIVTWAIFAWDMH